MTEAELYFFKDWFKGYSESFIAANPDEQKSIVLKEIHTEKVCQNMRHISQSLLMKEDERVLAECIALFHDVGRFPQLQKYKTFCDSISVNHGVLGAETLEELRILEKLPKHEQRIILQAVRYHNAFKMPNLQEFKEANFLKLIRDADKLDIWRVFIEHYEKKEDIGSSAILSLPDTEGYTESLLSTIYKNEMIALSNASNLSDYKLLQLSWVFDLNFKASFILFKERNYLNRFLAVLPQSDNIIKTGGFIKDYITQRMQND
jgi:hypothetical protein